MSVRVVSFWWAQRVSALCSIPVALWFVYVCVLVSTSGGGSSSSVTDIVMDGFTKAVFFIAGLTTLFYHAVLGIEVICHDYVSNLVLRNALIVMVKVVVFVTLILSVSGLVVGYQNFS